MTEHEITCQQADDLIAGNLINGVPLVSSGLTFADTMERTWCDRDGRDYLREIKDANGCRHWRIVAQCPHEHRRWSDSRNGFVCRNCGQVDPA